MIDRDDIKQDLQLSKMCGKPKLQMGDAFRFRAIDQARKHKRFLKQRYSIAMRRHSSESGAASIDNEELVHQIMKKIPRTNRQHYILKRLFEGQSQEKIAKELCVSPALISMEFKDIKHRSRRLFE